VHERKMNTVISTIQGLYNTLTSQKNKLLKKTGHSKQNKKPQKRQTQKKIFEIFVTNQYNWLFGLYKNKMY